VKVALFVTQICQKCLAHRRVKTSPVFEIALVLVRLDDVASRIVSPNHGIVQL
jgi:hypothetical protein